jgi:hypothetical protein
MAKPLAVDWPAVRVLAVAVGVREAARQMGISQDAVRQRSKREGWMASPKTVAQRALAKPVTSVSPNALSPADALANVFSERKHRTKLGLALSRNVRDVAAVHSTLWPEDHNERGILNLAVLTGQVNVWDAETGVIKPGPDAGKRVDLETGAIITDPTPRLNERILRENVVPEDGINKSEPE